MLYTHRAWGSCDRNVAISTNSFNAKIKLTISYYHLCTAAHFAKHSFVFLIEEYVFCAIYVTRHEGFGIDFTDTIDESSIDAGCKNL